MREAQAIRDQALSDERASAAAEIRRLNLEHDDAARMGRDQATRLENEIASLRSVLERETSARASVESRHADLIASMEDKEQKVQAALAEATQKTKDAEVLSRELEHARLEAEEHHRVEAISDAKLTALLTEQAETLRKLEEARARGEDLEEQIKFARSEGDEAFRALNEATREKDRLLRTQSLEADRLLRDHIAEADGDRAVLEHRFEEVQAAQETTERELKEALSELEVCKADLKGVREELQRMQQETAGMADLNEALRDELIKSRTANDDQARRLTALDHLLADMLDVAVSFRDTNARLFSSVQKTLSQSARQASKHISSLDGSTLNDNNTLSASVLEHRTTAAWTAYANPIDWSDPATSIEILRGFDLEGYSDAILKAINTIRKWQKQCKDYRDRARGKISFRNFGKGDLALFLPTRNSVAKPWAAFNGSPS
jgi:autophagy-related protein 11